MFAVVAGVGAWLAGKPVDSDAPGIPQKYRELRSLTEILADHRNDRWEVIVGPEGDGPFRSPEDMIGFSAPVGASVRFRYVNEFGQIDYLTPAAVDRGYLVVPLISADKRLTFMVLEKALPPEDPARKLAEKWWRNE
jgi:hypothetical protein